MISDDDLYRLAIFLGSASVVLIVIYHFLEVNSTPNPISAKAAQPAQGAGKQASALK
jgi:oligosaccharyl transferase complex subunit OST4